MTRVTALLRKELTDIRQHPGIFLPAALTGLLALVMPFVVAIVIPVVAGEPLADVATGLGEQLRGGLDSEGRAQAWVFQEFLILLSLSPISASMSVAAWSIVGEKQARTLEPLLATPLTTFELLAAKALSALLPGVAFSTIRPPFPTCTFPTVRALKLVVPPNPVVVLASPEISR